MDKSKILIFSKLYLKEVEKDVLKHFASSVLTAAKVRKLYKRGGKHYWEFYVPAVDGIAKPYRIELEVSNAYDARATALAQLLKEYGFEDKGMGAAIKSTAIK